MKTTRAAIALVASFSLAGCAPPRSTMPVAATAVTPTARADDGYAKIVAEVTPSVVLLVRTEPGGAVRFGAGLVVSGGATTTRIITNDHVASGPGVLRAMLHDAKRTSYTPMDGGLDRFLFENQDALRPARVLTADPIGDLALVEIDSPLGHRAILPLSDRAPAIGEQVLAFGRPQETVWSFTTGVVSALHHGMIQHDAVLSGGSSGGPLVSLDGRVVGVNTARVTNAARGLGFARPIVLALGLISPTVQTANARGSERPRPMTNDRGTPRSAVLACWHAQELASTALGDCFDWKSAWDDVLAAIARVDPRLHADAQRVRVDLEARGGYTGFESRNRVHAVDAFRASSAFEPASIAGLTGERAALALEVDRHRKIGTATAARDRRTKNGILVEIDDLRLLRDMLRRGLRIDDVRLVGESAAWVRLARRNTDGSALSFSEVWVHAKDGWRQRIAPTAADAGPLPTGWPPQLESHEGAMDELALQLLRRAETLAGGGQVGGGSERAAPAPPARR